MRRLLVGPVRVLLVAAFLWLALEIGVRLWVEWPLPIDFYGSLEPEAIPALQRELAVRVATGHGWAHLGWIADPRTESYRIDRHTDGNWEEVGRADLGSHLVRQPGLYRVLAEPRNGDSPRLLGEVTAEPQADEAPLYVPRIAGPWQELFRPSRYGDYVNDHTIFRDAEGNWRLLGITGHGSGNYADERRFAAAVSSTFPPSGGMHETAPVADFGETAWAPHVVRDRDRFHLFWSPHRLHRMVSDDGITWKDHRIVMKAPTHKFFRDAMIFAVAEGQWLLYTTARGTYFSRVDLYQSFDLDHWQYIGPALRTGWGSERNAIFASTESPFLIDYRGRFYLSVSYNNDSFVWTALLLPFRIWLDRASYNDTLIFQSDNPYDFGAYRGRDSSPSLLTHIEAHAPEFVFHPKTGRWYVTTAGWPWVSRLTSGEVAVAPLAWEQPARIAEKSPAGPTIH